MICQKRTPLQAIKDVDTFVSSLEQIWAYLAFHHLLINGSSAVNRCRQNESANSTCVCLGCQNKIRISNILEFKIKIHIQIFGVHQAALSVVHEMRWWYRQVSLHFNAFWTHWICSFNILWNKRKSMRRLLFMSKLEPSRSHRTCILCFF